MTYMSRSTRANSASASASTWSAVRPASSSSSSFRANLSLPSRHSPLAARQQVLLQELLVLLQAGDDRRGGGLQRRRAAASGRRARTAPARRTRSPRGSAGWPSRWRRAADCCRLARAAAHDLRDLLHAGDAVGDVLLRRQRRLGQQQVHAVADVLVVDPRILLEGTRVLGQPQRLLSARAGGSRSRSWPPRESC